jgi:hypothetical protein
MILRLVKQFLRILPRRILMLIVVLISIIFLFSNLFQSSIENDEEWYKHPEAYFTEVDCEHDEFTMKLYDKLTELLTNTLNNLKLTHFLCYGSLWGALRSQRTLEWDRNLDFCILNHELATIDEKAFIRQFVLQGLKYEYNTRRGKYIVTYKTVSAEITVFERVGSHMERIGWEKSLIPHFYVNYQNFPYHLVEKLPLPTEQFNGMKVSVPHDNFEIQKYLYPENWWRVIKPKGCPESQKE